MENFVIIEKDTIKLNSGLNEYMFGKTSYSSLITKAGLFYNGTNFETWTFHEIISQKVQDKDDYFVFYNGNNPFNNPARTLIDFFEYNDRNKMFRAAYAVVEALTKAATENVSVPLNGAGGIIIEDIEENPKILFLPQELYNYACNGLSSKDKANQNDCWLNPSLSDLPAICFFRATIAYTMLTGQFPYPSTNELERNADILDQKFLPLELRLPNVSQELATEINKSLKLTSSVVNLPGKKQKGTAQEDLTPTATFPLELLRKEKDNVPSEELQRDLEEKAQAYLKRQDSKVQTKRVIRRNTATIIVSFIAVIAAIITIRGFVLSHGEEYTTKGLTSVETLQAFFMNVNDKDVAALGNFVHGKTASRYTDAVSQVYVISKQRQAMSGDNGFAKPENYFLYVTDAQKNKQSGLYGMTNLIIDGVPYEMDIQVPRFKHKNPPLTEENGTTLTNKMETIHKVEYYRLRSENEENDILLDYICDIVTLSYRNKRWVISKFDSDITELELDSSAFKSEYFDALVQNDQDVIKTVNQLRFRYPWLPSEHAIVREISHLKQLEQQLYAGL